MPPSFSALQRAENSSIPLLIATLSTSTCFSALQRAENSSIPSVFVRDDRLICVSVLFSEPKIPQFGVDLGAALVNIFVSVLFSEPKIPQ